MPGSDENQQDNDENGSSDVHVNLYSDTRFIYRFFFCKRSED